ncbi:NTP transferase domain-containing protein [Desulfogranum mediterraneum]|uniref:NTP transferase domain-containing protein n=1 Tax=Desulfogranum mediterraneum TaxID=160661 RepID=UPI0003F4CD52|nr:NTP transferase domain-containing protein [Desulfogranum mediterraneum]
MLPAISAVVLAAGKGTRMKSDRAKVLHEVFFQPMVHHVLDTIDQLPVRGCAVIIGHQGQRVLHSLEGYQITPVIQEEQLGTGHAVLCAEQACQGAEHVLILCGDTPLIGHRTLEAMIATHLQQKAAVTLMTTRLADPFGYGRIIMDGEQQVLRIVEQKDASPAEQEIRDINAGIYLVRREFLFSALQQVGTENSQGEVYLTDIIAIAVNQGALVQNFSHDRAIDVLGVNSRVELAQAQEELQARHNRRLMLDGITMLDPASTLIAPSCSFAGEALLHAGVQLTGSTTIGRGCILSRGAVLHDCHLGDDAVVGAYAVLENCSLGARERVPPLIHRVS